MMVKVLIYGYANGGFFLAQDGSQADHEDVAFRSAVRRTIILRTARSVSFASCT